ncbi:MAG: hypothetical protein ACYC8T_34680 [Myxococcaceae bacterium]
MPSPAQGRRARRQRRGQAMLEYSMLNWVLIVGLVLASTVKILPGAKDVDHPRNLIEMFLDSYQTYYDSFYFVLNLPFP